MNGADIIAVIILAAIVIAVLAYLLHWLYRRSTCRSSERVWAAKR